MVGADGVDINLAGHAMSGWRSSAAEAARAGSTTAAGYDDLTVRNGTPGRLRHGIETERRQPQPDPRPGRRRSRATRSRSSGGSDNEIRRSERVRARRAASRSQRLRRPGGRRHHARTAASATGSRDRRPRAHRPQQDDARRRTRSADLGPRLSGSRRTRSPSNHIDGEWSAGNIVVLRREQRARRQRGRRAASSRWIRATSVVRRRHLRRGVRDRHGPAPQHGHGNEGDGIEVRRPARGSRTTARSPTATSGIDAVAGVIDLGGNRGGGNGNALQCRNVFCP